MELEELAQVFAACIHLPGVLSCAQDLVTGARQHVSALMSEVQLPHVSAAASMAYYRTVARKALHFVCFVGVHAEYRHQVEEEGVSFVAAQQQRMHALLQDGGNVDAKKRDELTLKLNILDAFVPRYSVGCFHLLFLSSGVQRVGCAQVCPPWPRQASGVLLCGDPLFDGHAPRAICAHCLAQGRRGGAGGRHERRRIRHDLHGHLGESQVIVEHARAHASHCSIIVQREPQQRRALPLRAWLVPACHQRRGGRLGARWQL